MTRTRQEKQQLPHADQHRSPSGPWANFPGIPPCPSWHTT